MIWVGVSPLLRAKTVKLLVVVSPCLVPKPSNCWLSCHPALCQNRHHRVRVSPRFMPKPPLPVDEPPALCQNRHQGFACQPRFKPKPTLPVDVPPALCQNRHSWVRVSPLLSSARVKTAVLLVADSCLLSIDLACHTGPALRGVVMCRQSHRRLNRPLCFNCPLYLQVGSPRNLDRALLFSDWPEMTLPPRHYPSLSSS